MQGGPIGGEVVVGSGLFGIVGLARAEQSSPVNSGIVACSHGQLSGFLARRTVEKGSA